MSKGTAAKIAESMYELIAEIGYEKASINKICSNVGVTKSSFYHFYKSKEHLLLEIVRRIYAEDYIELWLALLEISDGDIYKNEMLEIARDTVSAYESDSDFRKVYAEITLQSERISEIGHFFDKANIYRIEALNKVFEHGVKIGAFSSEFDAKLNVEILYSLFLGLDAVVLYDIPIRAKEVIKTILERMFEQ